jgi:double-stranded uracil-DNA glycosylase
VQAEGFPPIAAAASKVLVLGTLPGGMSLEKSEYYAQPRNSFWRIMADLFVVAADLPYPVRTERLTGYGVALWDVCKTAYRPGSLDASIRAGSAQANDFTTFYQEHQLIKMICFNGAKAAAMYEDKVLRQLPHEFKQIKSALLPSTSAANAATPYKEKLKLWSIVRKECET